MWKTDSIKDSKDRKERERIERARKLLKALNRLYQKDFYILLRTNGTLGGLVYSIERVPVNGDIRTVYRLVTPDNRVIKEYGDFMGNGMTEPEDLRPVIFHNLPIILTQRSVPGTDDEEENFTWIIVGERSKQMASYKIANKKYIAEIQELNYVLDKLQAALKQEEEKVKILGERNRILEGEVDRLSRQNMLLNEILYTMRAKLNEYLVRGFTSEEAIQNVLRYLDSAGKRAGAVMEQLTEFYEKERELKESRELSRALDSARSIGGEVYGELAEVRRENEELKKRLEELEKRLAEGMVKARAESGGGEG